MFLKETHTAQNIQKWFVSLQLLNYIQRESIFILQFAFWLCMSYKQKRHLLDCIKFRLHVGWKPLQPAESLINTGLPRSIPNDDKCQSMLVKIVALIRNIAQYRPMLINSCQLWSMPIIDNQFVSLSHFLRMSHLVLNPKMDMRGPHGPRTTSNICSALMISRPAKIFHVI